MWANIRNVKFSKMRILKMFITRRCLCCISNQGVNEIIMIMTDNDTSTITINCGYADYGLDNDIDTDKS